MPPLTRATLSPRSFCAKSPQGFSISAAFHSGVTCQTWDADYENREIAEVDMHRADVSVVNQGANPNTSVSARSRAAAGRTPPPLEVYALRTHVLYLRGRGQ